MGISSNMDSSSDSCTICWFLFVNAFAPEISMIEESYGEYVCKCGREHTVEIIYKERPYKEEGNEEHFKFSTEETFEIKIYPKYN